MFNKFKFKILLTAFFIFLSINQNLLADFPQKINPCMSQWPDYPYENDGDYFMFELDECPGCQFVAEYYYRNFTIGSEHRRDLQITQIFTIGEGCDDCLALYKDILQTAIRKIFEANPMGWYKDTDINPPEDPDRCNYDYYATQSSCVQRINQIGHQPNLPDVEFFGSGINPMVESNKNDKLKSNQESNDILLVNNNWNWRVIPCLPNAVCCFGHYKLCWNSDGVLNSISTTALLSIPSTCYPEETCYPACNFLDFEWVRSGVQTGKNGINNDTKVEVIQIIPNPVNENLSLRVINDYKGKIKIDIYDLNGNNINSILGDKQDDLFVLDINLNNTLTGTYLIKIDFFDSNFYINRMFTKIK